MERVFDQLIEMDLLGIFRFSQRSTRDVGRHSKTALVEARALRGHKRHVPKTEIAQPTIDKMVSATPVVAATTKKMPLDTASSNGASLRQFYRTKIESLELIINERTQNLRRLEAQRNILNAKGMLTNIDDVVYGS